MPPPPNVTQKVLQYQYPPLLLRFPQLIRLVYWCNYITQLRKWYIVKAWRGTLKNAKSGFVATDFGCGECQYLLPFCNNYPSATFQALDVNAESIAFAKTLGAKNLIPIQFDIEKNAATTKADVAICIGVLHYINNDVVALQNMYASLNRGGQLLVYVPITGEILTGLYRYIFNHYQQYESLNDRKRVYTESEILGKLSVAGFTIVSKRFAYGFWGKLSHELLNSCTTLYFSAIWPVKVVALISLLLLLPAIYLCMFFDLISTNTSGNGLLLKVAKI
jgi:SAM-dependent methyltransferase